MRWAACRILVGFNRAASKSEIMNYNESSAQDFGVSSSGVRAYLDFVAYFLDGGVLYEVTFSPCAGRPIRGRKGSPRLGGQNWPASGS